MDGHPQCCAARCAEHHERLARELHDGVVQELALLVRHARREAGEDPGPRSAAALEAATRGLAAARRALVALRRPAVA